MTFQRAASLGGTPYHVFKSNTAANEGGTMARMFHLYNFNRDEYLSHYHERSNVESIISRPVTISPLWGSAERASLSEDGSVEVLGRRY